MVAGGKNRRKEFFTGAEGGQGKGNGDECFS
jgi:hypothetical protein